MLEPKVYEMKKTNQSGNDDTNSDEFIACIKRVKRLADGEDINIKNRELLESIDRYLKDIEGNSI